MRINIFGSKNMGIENSDYKRHDTDKYHQTIELLREEPSCVGLHLCGAYIANRCRKRGILDEFEKYSYLEFKDIIAANKETIEWVKLNR